METFELGARVLYSDPRAMDHLFLGTVQHYSSSHAGCVAVRLDDAKDFVFVLPEAALRVASPEEEAEIVMAKNQVTFMRASQALKDAHAKCNYTPRAAGWPGQAREASVRIEHFDVEGYDERWTITVTAPPVHRRRK